MLVLRPADAEETTIAWKLAMENIDVYKRQANSSILQSHMLEICPLIAANKPRLEVHFLGIGIQMCIRDSAGCVQ